VVTEWPHYRGLDWERAGGVMARRIVVDARNCLDAELLTACGFHYESVGRRPRLGLTGRAGRRQHESVAGADAVALPHRGGRPCVTST